jgi:hypothetical protein
MVCQLDIGKLLYHFKLEKQMNEPQGKMISNVIAEEAEEVELFALSFQLYVTHPFFISPAFRNLHPVLEYANFFMEDSSSSDSCQMSRAGPKLAQLFLGCIYFSCERS